MMQSNSPLQTQAAASGVMPIQPNSSPALPSWKSVVTKHFPDLMPAFEACIATVCELMLEDLSVCPSIVLVGPPSTLKTTILDCFKTEFTYITDNFTPASFVSQYAAADKKKLKEIDLLPKIKHKAMIVKDLAPIFSKREEDLMSLIGILTRVLDGSGYLTDAGTHGRRGYEGEYRFAMLGATTPPRSRLWEVMARLGPRLLFLYVDAVDGNEDEQVDDLLSPVSYGEKVEECKKAVSDYLTGLWTQNGGFGGQTWNKQAELRPLVQLIVKLTKIGVLLRGRPSVESTRNRDDGSYQFSPSVVEGPKRLQNLLYNLARGRAISEGRTQINFDDVKLAGRVTLSSGPDQYRRLLKAVMENHGQIGSATAARSLGVSQPTARAVANEMANLGILEVVGPTNIMKIQLAPDHIWLPAIL